MDEGPSLETSLPNASKILHWFDWGKKKVNVYDIVKNTSECLELDINFKIPSFSRSIIVPSGDIYLMGGEEPEYFSRKEVYLFRYAERDFKLHPKAPMPHKKFDFTICYLNGKIYVICGKDSSSEVLSSSEGYDVVTDTWTTLAPTVKKRYAATAIGAPNNKVYLFGGRTDLNN